eukprot:CAMPEP_0197654242 /NCGR_PEP_ID=MMETSP1338-20131121/38735_1 /TAXON_ID=43686 ORGANISM="Pelagodinium beii, Strain RCC1491" /NCGR_SAMPLE_ID=MMETSP1338 /ASSEMBLY_ACC=CAM_ASM_000754 /LENGTH=86 /DNA_ID=CAMNT_0043229651 /DNA_START=328 /DNA_END=588 /DNA_ORIENTATION=+
MASAWIASSSSDSLSSSAKAKSSSALASGQLENVRAGLEAVVVEEPESVFDLPCTATGLMIFSSTTAPDMAITLAARILPPRYLWH